MIRYSQNKGTEQAFQSTGSGAAGAVQGLRETTGNLKKYMEDKEMKKTTDFIKEALIYNGMINETDHIRCEIESTGFQFAEIMVAVMEKGKRKPYTFHHATLDTIRNQVKGY